MTESPMPAQETREEVPRAALIGAGLLIAFALAIASIARMTADDGPPPDITDASVTQERDLTFDDLAGGGFSVIDPTSGAVIATYNAGKGGFIRGVMRSLTFDRKRRGIGREDAFRLTSFADGRLSIRDLATGRVIDLGAFGPANAHNFVRLLTANGAL